MEFAALLGLCIYYAMDLKTSYITKPMCTVYLTDHRPLSHMVKEKKGPVRSEAPLLGPRGGVLGTFLLPLLHSLPEPFLAGGIVVLLRRMANHALVHSHALLATCPRCSHCAAAGTFREDWMEGTACQLRMDEADKREDEEDEEDERDKEGERDKEDEKDGEEG